MIFISKLIRRNVAMATGRYQKSSGVMLFCSVFARCESPPWCFTVSWMVDGHPGSYDFVLGGNEDFLKGARSQTL